MKSPWPLVRLGDHLEFITSGSRGWSEYVREHGSRFIRIQNVGQNELILDDIACVQPPAGAEADRTLVRSGDVLLSITADLGRTAVIPDKFGPAHINQHLALLRIRDFDPYFVSAFIAHHPGVRGQLLRLDRGGVKSGLNFDDIRSIQLPLPPIREQRRMMAILDKADAIRRMRRKSVLINKELLRSTFLELFGNPVTNPKGWPLLSLDGLLRLKPHIGTMVPSKDQGNQLCVRVGEIGATEVEFSNCKHVSLSGNELNKFKLEKNDIILARAIGSEEHLGKASIFLEYPGVVVFDSHVMRLRFDQERLDSIFFLFWLSSSGGRSLFLKKTRRTAVQFNINGEQIAQLQLPLPPIMAQRRFRGIWENHEHFHKTQITASIESETFFSCLLQRAFGGEL